MGTIRELIQDIIKDNATVAMLCLTALGAGCLLTMSLGGCVEVKDAFNVLIGAVAGMAMGKATK